MNTATLTPGLMAVRPDADAPPVKETEMAAAPAPQTQAPAPAATEPSVSLGERFGNFIRAVLPPLLGFAFVIGVWALVAMNSSDFPSPAKTLDAAVVLFSDPFYSNGPNDQGIGWNILSSLKRVAIGFGVAALVGIPLGFIIGRLKMEKYVADFVWKVHRKVNVTEEKLTWSDRIERAWLSVKEIVGKVWPYVIVGIALGAGIHGYVPEDFMASIMGREAWWSVPIAVLLGVPMYTNAAGVIPIVEALLGKGAALGTVLAFMMSVIALSAPEMIILRKALKPRLIATFAGIVATGILLVGYVFNLIL